jgi:hypothetical protein
MIGMFAAAASPPQHANAISNGKTIPCLSEILKCLQKNTPFILPFP